VVDGLRCNVVAVQKGNAGLSMRMDRRSSFLPILLCLCTVASPANAQTAGALKPGEVFRDCPDCAEMVVVPAGEFEMGSTETPAEAPQHHVVVAAPFAIGRREVTFAEWDLCAAEGACKYSPSDHGWGRGARPVIDVSWDDLKEFIAWLSQKTGHAYRLPSEAEWEYAARAGSTSAFWWGRDVGVGHAKCDDCGGDAGRQTAPTGSFRPNPFGLYDTTGNAAEWVQDCWNLSYRGAPLDGSAWTRGDCSLRVLRGGSFANKASAGRSASRFRYDEDIRYYANGFRVARDLK
jgi:formylglycine-generating enzyme required for sulfatase activity